MEEWLLLSVLTDFISLLLIQTQVISSMGREQNQTGRIA